MTKHFNKKELKDTRRMLRKNQTFTEKIVWLYLRNRATDGYKFRRQYSVDRFVLDFYCPELKMAIELDGSVHDVPEQKEYDAERQKYIEKFGIRFVRIRNEEIAGNAEMAFARIEEAIRDLTPSPSPYKGEGLVDWERGGDVKNY